MTNTLPIVLPEGTSLCDGVVTLRAPRAADRAVLLAGRDAEFHRWLGAGSDDPKPTACILHDGDVIGWIDADDEPGWLHAGEANVGYQLFASARGKGFATRAVQLSMHFLGGDRRVGHAVALIDPANVASLAVARRSGFIVDPSPRADAPPGQICMVRAVPSWRYADGVVAIRPQRATDLAMHMASVDSEQQRWLWPPTEIEQWNALEAPLRQQHIAAWLDSNARQFATGPTWGFAIDLMPSDDRGEQVACVGYVECGLANPHVACGEANIAYSVHPDYRGRGIAARAVGCALRFLREHTGARQAVLRIDTGNRASLAVARKLGVALQPSPDGVPSMAHGVLRLR